jgi:trehalose 6-phosphate phosphatase
LPTARKDNTVKSLKPQVDPTRFVKKISKAGKRALMLNYDGTLAPFSNHPGTAVPYPGIREILNALLDDGRTRVVLVSGRATKDIVSLLGIGRFPEIWGSHGLEHLMPDRSYEVINIHERAKRGLAEASDWTAHTGLANRCEQKIGSLAIHLRGLAPESAEYVRGRILEKWSLIALHQNLLLQEYDDIIELRFSGMDKSSVVRRVLSEIGEDTPVAYLGDGLTDEDAFNTIKGRGLSVLVREELRPTNADLWLQPPDELIRFLCNWVSVSVGV